MTFEITLGTKESFLPHLQTVLSRVAALLHRKYTTPKAFYADHCASISSFSSEWDEWLNWAVHLQFSLLVKKNYPRMKHSTAEVPGTHVLPEPREIDNGSSWNCLNSKTGEMILCPVSAGS